MFKINEKPKGAEEKIIDIQTGIKGNVQFTGPINLRISGDFEGDSLEIKGILIIGEKAVVKAKTIKGENITIQGKVKADIIAAKRLELLKPARVIGNVDTPVLIVNEGAMIKGSCEMPVEEEKIEHKNGSKKKE